MPRAFKKTFNLKCRIQWEFGCPFWLTELFYLHCRTPSCPASVVITDDESSLFLSV